MESEIKIGEVFPFGRYAAEGEPQPLNWLVVQADEESELLITQEALDLRPYHDRFAEVTWEESALRAWLNGEFFEKTFTDAEKTAILPTVNDNGDDPATEDLVFIPSAEEVEQLFACADEMKAYAAPAVKAKGAFTSTEGSFCWWWLRTHGRTNSSEAIVDIVGGVYAYGFRVDSAAVTVRPMLRVKLT